MPQGKEKRVKVKREPTEIKPLSEYVDDRLELIKQAFACLKPKTIKGVTPKFLQKESLESIQEKCLDEVLGISKKRLLSIIRDTKCPTDTESSDDEVENIVEHISLDEISSDDESKSQANARKKMSKKTSTKGTKVKSEKKETGPADKPPEKKEYSVLELLELQARARAIRSQLALEPVTKIEIDGDDHSDGEKSEQKPPQKKEKRPDKKRKEESTKATNDNGTSKKKKRKSPIRSPQEERNIAVVGKVITVKRNFRNNKMENTQEVKDSCQKEVENVVNNAERESSPEVMTILASPETLCISSDEDEKSATTQSKPESTTKENSHAKRESPERVPEPPEEGELEEEQENSHIMLENAENKTIYDDNQEPSNTRKEDSSSDQIKDPNDSSVGLDQSKDDADVLCVQLEDDCIDLECNDPIEEVHVDPEMKKEEQAVVEDIPVEVLDSSEGEDDQSSASNDAKSWGERWLESSKVSKILATSKLGNQLRRKIKLTKLKEKQNSTEEPSKGADTAENKNSPTEDPLNEAEEGSVKHYEKIVDKSDV